MPYHRFKVGQTVVAPSEGRDLHIPRGPLVIVRLTGNLNTESGASLTGWTVWSGKVRSGWPRRKDRHGRVSPRASNQVTPGLAVKAELLTGVDGVSKPAGAAHRAAGRLTRDGRPVTTTSVCPADGPGTCSRGSG